MIWTYVIIAASPHPEIHYTCLQSAQFTLREVSTIFLSRLVLFLSGFFLQRGWSVLSFYYVLVCTTISSTIVLYKHFLYCTKQRKILHVSTTQACTFSFISQLSQFVVNYSNTSLCLNIILQSLQETRI